MGNNTTILQGDSRPLTPPKPTHPASNDPGEARPSKMVRPIKSSSRGGLLALKIKEIRAGGHTLGMMINVH